MEKKTAFVSAKATLAESDNNVGFPGVEDGWSESILKMLETQKHTDKRLREYMRSLADGHLPPVGESPEQRFMFGQLLNQVYDKHCNEAAPESFVNTGMKLVTEFMSEDFLVSKQQVFSSWVDEELYREVNKYTNRDSLLVLVEEYQKTQTQELEGLQKWEHNLEAWLESHQSGRSDSGAEVQGRRTPSQTWESSDGHHSTNKAKELREWLIQTQLRLEDEHAVLESQRTELDETLTGVRGTFEKPSIDISAKVKCQLGKMFEVQDKLLFTLQDHKEVGGGVSMDSVQRLVLRSVHWRFHTAGLKAVAASTQVLPTAVFAKYLSQSQERIFTKFDCKSELVRNQGQQKAIHVVDGLDGLLDLSPHPPAVGPVTPGVSNGRPHPAMKDFYLELLSASGQGCNFIKVVTTDRKLTNLTVSRLSLWVCALGLRADYQGLGRVVLEEVLQCPQPERYFREIPSFPSYIFRILTESMDSLHQSHLLVCEADVLGPNGGLVQMAANTGALLTTAEQLDALNLRVARNFTSIFEAQSEWLEFQDYYQANRILEISTLTAGIRDRLNRGLRVDRLAQLTDETAGFKLKAAFWVQHGLLFKLSQQTASEHSAHLMLKDQMKHPQIETWLNLVLNTAVGPALYDLQKLTEDLFELSQVNPEDLHSERKLASQTLESYTKLLMLRSRSAFVRLLSYANFGRSVQKTLNLRFLKLCEASDSGSDKLGSEPLRHFRKHQSLRQSKMFDQKDYQETKSTFDEDVTATKTTELLAALLGDIKYSRLVSHAGHKPFTYTNPSKGGTLGGCVSGTVFEPAEAENDQEEGVAATDDQNVQSQRHLGGGTKKSIPPDHLFAEDTISLERAPEAFLESGQIGECLLAVVRDSTGTKVLYDASVHDAFEIVQDVACLLSFFLENELAYYQDDQFEDLDMQFQSNQADEVLTTKNFKSKIPFFEKHFNYEYLVTRTLEAECLFQSAKVSLCQRLLRFSQQVVGQQTTVKVYELITELMSRRPEFDLHKYEYANENFSEWMHRINLPRDPSLPYRGEIHNLLTTIFDNYAAETDYLKNLDAVLEALLAHEQLALQSLDAVFELFGVGSSPGASQPSQLFATSPSTAGTPNQLLALKPRREGSLVVDILKNVDSAAELLMENFVQPSYLDRVTFSSFLFDFHFKDQIDSFLGLERLHQTDFLAILNDFMNSPLSRYKHFVRQQLKLMAVGETQQLVLSVLEHRCADRDDLVVFEGDLLPSPANAVAVMAATTKFFRSLKANARLDSYSESRGCNIGHREQMLIKLNQSFAYWLNLHQTLDVRESLVESSYLSLIYKAQRHTVKPVYEALGKNLRFEKPDDLLHTAGNLLEQFLDQGDACKLSLDDVRSILKEDPVRGADQSHHLSRVISLRRLVLLYTGNLSLVVQSNAISEKVAECEVALQACKVLSNKDSVMEHLYKFDMEDREDRAAFTPAEVMEDYKRGETSFKYHLHQYQWSFIQMVSWLLQKTKQDSLLDLSEVVSKAKDTRCEEFLGRDSLMFGYDPDESGAEGEVAHQLRENLFGAQDEETPAVPTDFDFKGKPRKKRVSVVEIPHKDCKFENITLSVACDPFIAHLSKMLRRASNLLAVWLQSRKLVQSLYDKDAFISFNPTDVISFHKESDLTFGKLQQSVMKMLHFKHTKQTDDGNDRFALPFSIFDEYGSLKYIFKIPTSRGFKAHLDKDLQALAARALSPKENTFFSELELFIFKKSMVMRCDPEQPESSKRFEHLSEEEIQATSQVLRDKAEDSRHTGAAAVQMRDYSEAYMKDILAHLKRLKMVEIDEINRSAPSSVIEKQTSEKVLSVLGQVNFKLGKKTYGFGTHLGFASDGKLSNPINSALVKKLGVDRTLRASSYDYYHIEEVQESDLFLFYSQTRKLLDTVSVKLLVSGLDMDPMNMDVLHKKSMPFYALNSLRLQELDKLLFNSETSEAAEVTGADEEKSPPTDSKVAGEETEGLEPGSSTPSAKERRVKFADQQPGETGPVLNESSGETLAKTDDEQDHAKNQIIGDSSPGESKPKQKFEYRKLRQYLYIVKRIELKNRSASRAVFTFVDELKERMNSILEDAKLSKPDLVFNTYLNCLYENEQRTLVLGLLDSINQLRWVENFNDLIDINLEKIKNDKDLIFGTRSLLIELLFKKTTSFGVFYDLFTSGHNETLEDQVMQHYPYKRPSAQLQRQLASKSARRSVSNNNLFNLFEKSFLATAREVKHYGYRKSNRCFNTFLLEEFEMQWANLFTHLLSFHTPQRTFISRKIFDIKLYTERNVSMPKETIMPHNLWIYKCLDAHRLLDLNLKNMFLMEALNLKIMNDLYCDRNNEDRASVQLDVRHMSGVRIPTIRRQIKPTLLPFVTNSMFSKEPNYEFCRMILKLMSTELRMTSFILDKDLRVDRFPDLNFDPMHPENTNSHQVLDLVLKKQVNINAVWADDPLDMSVPMSGSQGSPKKSKASWRNTEESGLGMDSSRERLTTDVYGQGDNKSYTPGLYNDHKLDILKCFVESFRTSFFLPDVSQAFTMCYLLMREFMSCATTEEVSQAILSKETYFFKSKDCQERDRLIVSSQKDLLYSVVKKSYILETSLYGDQIAIKKSTLHDLIGQWNDQVAIRLQDELRRRELVYLDVIDQHTRTAEQYQLEKDLVDFYFKHTMKQFNNTVNSRLAFRNSSFVCELDSLKRFCQNIKYDVELMFDKITDKLVKKSQDEIQELREHNSRLRVTHLEAVKKFKQELTDMIDQERQTTLERMKEHKYKLEVNEVEPRDPVANGKFYQVQVSVYNQSEYHKFAVMLFRRMKLLRVFSGFKLFCKMKKEESQLITIEGHNQERELLTTRLEELLKAEGSSKEAILTYQKNIAKLEIQNNLLRKEIHNSQFERIKLLKRVNEVNNQCDEVNWEQEKVTTEEKAKIKAKAVGKSGILHDYNKEYLKSLFAEHNIKNVDILNHPERLSERMAAANQQIAQLRQGTASTDGSSFHRSSLGPKPASSATKIKHFLANDSKLMEIESVSQNKEILQVLQRKKKAQELALLAERTGQGADPASETQAAKPRVLPSVVISSPEKPEQEPSPPKASIRPPTAFSRKTGLRSATTQADSVTGLLRLSPVHPFPKPSN